MKVNCTRNCHYLQCHFLGFLQVRETGKGHRISLDRVSQTKCEKSEKWGIANVPVIEGILDVLPNCKQHVKCVDENKVKNPSTKFFKIAKSTCRDNLC